MTTLVERALGDWHTRGLEDLIFFTEFISLRARLRGPAAMPSASYTYHLAIGYRAKWSGANSVNHTKKEP